MNERDDVETMLGELGSAAGPQVDPVFANRLDADLRAMHDDQVTTTTDARPVWVPVLAGLAAAIAGAVVWSITLGGGGGSGIEIVPATSSDATDGRDPGATEVAPATSSDKAAPAAAGATEVAPATSSDKAAPAAAGAADATSTPTSPGDSRPTTTAPSSTRPATTASTTPATTASTQTPSSTTPTAPSTSTTTVDGRQAIDVTIVARPSDRLRIDWVPTGDFVADAWRIEVLRGDRVATVALIRQPSARSTTIDRNPIADVGFRVVAIDSEGDVIVESDVIPQPSR